MEKDYKKMYEEEKRKNEDLIKTQLTSKEFILMGIAEAFGEEGKEEIEQDWGDHEKVMRWKDFYDKLYSLKKEKLQELLDKIKKLKN